MVVGGRALATVMVAAPLCQESNDARVEILGVGGGEEGGVGCGRWVGDASEVLVCCPSVEEEMMSS